MSIKQEKAWKTYHDKESKKKRKAVSKKLITFLSIPMFKRSLYHRQLLHDVKFMNEDLLDVVYNGKFTSKEGYIRDINAYLSLECETYGYKPPLDYKVGKMDKLVILILMHHEIKETFDKLLP